MPDTDADWPPVDEELPVPRSPLEQAQRALGWMSLRHDVVMNLFRLATDWLEEESLLTASLDILQEFIGAEAGSVIMLDRQEGDLYFAAATGPVSTPLRQFRLERHEGIAGWAMDTGRVLRINNVQDETHWAAEISDQLGFEVRQLMAAPIRVRNRTIGCLELLNKFHPSSESFTADDADVVADAAECIGILFSLRGERPGR